MPFLPPNQLVKALKAKSENIIHNNNSEDLFVFAQNEVIVTYYFWRQKSRQTRKIPSAIICVSFLGPGLTWSKFKKGQWKPTRNSAVAEKTRRACVRELGLWAYYNIIAIRVLFERDTTSYEELCAFEQ